MKLSAAIIASFATLASATNLNLRSATKTSTDNIDARIAVHGLVNELSDDDMDIVGKSIISAYNEAYAGEGMSLGTFEPQSSASIQDGVKDCRRCRPDDDMMAASSAMIMASFVTDCRRCRPDDDATSTLVGSQLADVHGAFENKFCHKLRESGSVNLANVKGCSFSFLETPVETKVNGEAVEAQVTLKGSLHDFSKSDVAIFENSVVSAYNEAFVAAQYSMKSIEALADIDTVGDCRRCRPDDDMMLEESSTLVMARASVDDCRRCRPDDDSLELTDSQFTKMQSAFEKSLCTKLHNSGSANFANVHGCRFRFVYDPVTDAKFTQE